MKILSVFGTRPEAIKMAPVLRSLASDSFFESKCCITGQHRQMLDQVLDVFDIRPDFDFNLMQPNQTLRSITHEILEGMHTVFQKWKPDMVLVHGDTTTTFAASLSAYYEKITVGHVEAGLRSGNKYAPWPEEMNRHLTDVIADIHFAPTNIAQNNLLREGIPKERIYITGNTVIDALQTVISKLQNDKIVNAEIKKKFSFLNFEKKMILVTGHRRENFGYGFEQICDALVEIAHRDDVQIVFPVHLNPSIYEPAHRRLSGIQNMFLIEPQSYLPFVALMHNSYLILTDSGGIQEEAPSLGKPVLIMRETTERPDAIDTGSAKLVGITKECIVKSVFHLIDDYSAYKAMSTFSNPYGDGQASSRICCIIKKFFRN